MKIKKKKNLFLKKIIKNIKKIKGKNIKLIDTRKKNNNLFDFFLICEGKTNIQVKTIFYKIEKSIYKNFNIKPKNIEGLNNLKWILIDYNFLIVNIFIKKNRNYYNIDNFWDKFPKINF
ncbi:MAG: ribosome silencing factor [Candidatus Shikimatogenerans sp. JK-2022]|nr:ribosome silencing factor [Candidatus Shikimatogenerans bostrichidophilus]